MKFITAAAAVLGMAPFVLGKAVHNVYPVRRNSHLSGGGGPGGKNSVQASEAQLAELARLIGVNRGSGTSINFLWVNIGGGAATTVINAASTVTVTQTVNAGGAGGDAAATAPPAVATSDAAGAATTTVAGGATATAGGAGGATHSVTVGGPQGLSFNPQQLTAAIGDTVIFTFLSQNHTATQSAFDKPCAALAGGMDSGFQANANNTVNPPPQVAMQIMVDTPLWFYCRQAGHCGKGMVLSINPTAAKTHAQFQAMAIQQAGQGSGGAITGNGGNAGAGAGGANASASASASAVDTATAGAGGAGATATGLIAADGSCLCAVQCSFGGFPNQAMQGRDSFGGAGGAIPMAMVQAAVPARRA
ncbi:uncharacterized protein C8A04DRAFT_9788 [Dichotomopilus funicola]|uniref:Uncharacterized protein n=1 Tax=Dichotomopilus funicola TaxID=1934379 RepID=A0AAN6V8Q0_9PEZI|nr:hypothetical protein C8A04DRAFT_9788 [Dichotomopilus funicola]